MPMRCSFGGIRRILFAAVATAVYSAVDYSSETEIWHKNLKSGSVNRPVYARSVCWSSVRTSRWLGSSEVVTVHGARHVQRLTNDLITDSEGQGWLRQLL